MTADADRNLLFGLLALQNGMISRDQLVAAFGAWTGARGRLIADYLVEHGALTSPRRTVLEALTDEHMALHSGDPESSLAALEVGPNTRATLAVLAGSGVETSLARVGTAAHDDDASTSDGDGSGSSIAWRRGHDASGSGLGDESTGRAGSLEPAGAGQFELRADVDRRLTPDTMGIIEGSHDVSDMGMPHANDGSPSPATTLFPADVGTNSHERFRVIRRHARGGLGAVFIALDTELNREVALKQILDAYADEPSCRQRFLTEAEITGGLEHPGIVPVYSLGTYRDGRPYYAMRFIKGDSLREAIKRFHDANVREAESGRRSLELRKLLRGFTDVCNAIEYAHSRGILHRDIKPGNVIVGHYGETLVVDWGLAKPLGHAVPEAATGERTLVPSAASGSSETVPGSAIGTPAFMSPEQAAGELDRLGPRSDVYSLGATLYCLLTGKSPFGGDVDEVLRKVQRGDFRAPRQLDPAIDPALEAVCLKAMATAPADRYASCRALAEEVERWMADLPVTAYREPLARRARRWAKQNRTAVTGSVVALVVGVIGLSAVLAVQTRANAELTRSKSAVQARYDVAVDAIQTFHTGVSEDFLLKQNQFKELRDRLLKSAAEFYDKLGSLLGNESDLASRRAMAQANFELAKLTGMVGRSEDALAMHQALLDRREALASGPASDPATRIDVGQSLMAIAGLLSSTGRTAEAEATFRRSESLLADLTQRAGTPAARAALARCRTLLGDALSNTGKAKEALAAYRLARTDQEALAAAAGATNESRHDLAQTIYRIGNLLSETVEQSEAEAEYRKALEIFKALADADPSVTQFRANLARCHHALALLRYRISKPVDAEPECREALAIYKQLTDDHPAVNEFRSSMAKSHNLLGWLLHYGDRRREGQAEYRKAIALNQKLVDENPTIAEFSSSLADCCNNLALTLPPVKAEVEQRKTLALRKKIVDENPAVPEFLSRLGNAYNNLGGLLNQEGRPSEAEPELRNAVVYYQKAVKASPNVHAYRSELGLSLANLAELLCEAKKQDEALSIAERALAVLAPLFKDYPEVAEYRSTLAMTYLIIGKIHHDAGDIARAASECKTAMLLEEGHESIEERDPMILACARIFLGDRRPAGHEHPREGGSGRGRSSHGSAPPGRLTWPRYRRQRPTRKPAQPPP